MAPKIKNIKMAPTNPGNGSVTSPLKYDAAVDAETTEVDVKSKRRRAAPIVERDLVETFRRYVYGAPEIGRAEASSSMIGRQRKRERVAANNDIGELDVICVLFGLCDAQW